MLNDFNLLKDRKHIWVSISGGTDSALVLYFVTKYCYENKLDVKITPWTMVDSYRPGNDIAVANIIKCIQDVYPHPYEETIFSHYQQDDKKIVYSKQFYSEIKNAGTYDTFIDGLTAPPPIDDMKLVPGFYELFLTLGDPRVTSNYEKGLSTYKYAPDGFLAMSPFINLSKLEIAKMYETEGLMDTLFPLTQSCISREMRPCYQCWWCKEKHWAFGLYDMS